MTILWTLWNLDLHNSREAGNKKTNKLLLWEIKASPHLTSVDKTAKKHFPTLSQPNLNLPSDVHGNYLGIRSIHPGVGETSGADQGAV